MKSEVSYQVNFIREEDGRYTAVVPAFDGAATFGDTFEHAQEMAREMIEGFIELYEEAGRELPASDTNHTSRITLPVSHVVGA